MGFLASLFGRAAVEDKPARERENMEDGMEEWGDEYASQSMNSVLPRLKVGDHLDVLADDRPPFSGRIASVHGRNLALRREQNQLSFQVCEAGAEVHIKGYTDDKIPFDLKGIVVESTKTAFKVKNLTVISHNHNEFRSNFRLVVNAPATLYAQEDVHLQVPEECSLVNISAGGACIQSEFLHGEDEALWLKVQLMNYAPMIFLGQVVRASEPVPGVFQYGFLFAELDERMSESLTKMLTNIQTGNTQVHYRHDYGHW